MRSKSHLEELKHPESLPHRGEIRTCSCAFFGPCPIMGFVLTKCGYAGLYVQILPVSKCVIYFINFRMYYEASHFHRNFTFCVCEHLPWGHIIMFINCMLKAKCYCQLGGSNAYRNQERKMPQVCSHVVPASSM